MLEGSVIRENNDNGWGVTVKKKKHVRVGRNWVRK